eukprot:202740-Prorocentrum_minimum.AAC.1
MASISDLGSILPLPGAEDKLRARRGWNNSNSHFLPSTLHYFANMSGRGKGGKGLGKGGAKRHRK